MSKVEVQKNPVSDFLESLHSDNTKRVFRAGLQKFFSVGTGDDLDKVGYQYLTHLQKNRSHLVKDIAGIQHLEDIAPKTKSTYRTGIIAFLHHNGVFFSDQEKYLLSKSVPKGENHPVTRDEPITRDLLLKLLAHADIRDRAIIFCIVSSGCRGGELMRLNQKDLNLDIIPARFWIRKPKTRADRIAFISQEAVAAVREYLQVRDRYIEKRNMNNKRTKRGELKDDGRLFPFWIGHVGEMWRRLLDEAGLTKLDMETARRTLRAHGMRAFFLSQSKRAIPQEIAECLGGHAGYLSSAYRKYTEDELAGYYLQAEPTISISTRAVLTKEAEQRIENLQNTVDNLKELVMHLTDQAGMDEDQTDAIQSILNGKVKEPSL